MRARVKQPAGFAALVGVDDPHWLDGRSAR